ncbi:MAG: HAD family phosphatase [Cytophagales bacterium]|nr:HAD family phosphatase [Cytophagales bacterium]
MNNKYQAVIFDMDGVVIDTKPGIEAFWQRWANHKGFTISEKIMDEYIHGCPVWLTIEKVFPMLIDSELESLMHEIHETEANLSYHLINGIHDVLVKLSDNNIPVGLVTSGYLKKVSKVFEELVLTSFFHQVVTADMVKQGKPHPEPFLLAAEKLGVKPADCVVFEDSISGITGAAKAGMYPIGINKQSMQPVLKSVGARYVVPDFTVIDFVNSNASRHISIHKSNVLAF